ncbi:uncharacterized protein PHACADRAFT_93100, partial [Phanerochaete carnosa HHB-10118-sp]
TSRDLAYHHCFSPAQSSKPTLPFCHGFPSTSRNWRHIVPRPRDKGYGVLALDMLGYGGTDKPTDPAAYIPSLISKDIVDILDAEKLGNAIAVGHDLGCKAISRLANYYPELILAYVFFAVSFVQVLPPMDFEVFQGLLKKQPGYETLGYWKFLSEPGANKVIQAHVASSYNYLCVSHIDSFVGVTFFHDFKTWIERLAPTDVLKQSPLEDFIASRPSYLFEEDMKHFVETFRRDGFAAPTCWYKIVTSQLSAKDDQQIIPERKFPPASAPIYFGEAKHDYTCPPKIGYASFTWEVFSRHSVTMKEYGADHWLILSHGGEISRDLEKWIEGTVATKAKL